MKYIISGLEDSGKSLVLASMTRKLVIRNARWLKTTGVPRPIKSNLRYSPTFIAAASAHGIEIQHWNNLAEIVDSRDCDIIIDEIGPYFESRLWTDLSLEVRRWLAQASKLGVDIYGTAQDFAQVDKSFRRLVNKLEHVVKFVGSPRPTPSRPPVKKPWGLCLLWELNPRSYSEDDKKIEGFLGIPMPFLITKRDCELYDTRQLQDKSKPLPLTHLERSCTVCGKVHVVHT